MEENRQEVVEELNDVVAADQGREKPSAGAVALVVTGGVLAVTGAITLGKMAVDGCKKLGGKLKAKAEEIQAEKAAKNAVEVDFEEVPKEEPTKK